MSPSAQKKAKERAREIGALAEEALQGVQPAKIIEGISNAKIEAGKNALAEVEKSLRLGEEIASLAKESAQIDFESMEKEGREAVAQYLSAAGTEIASMGGEYEKRSGDSRAREAGELMLASLDSYANTGNKRELEKAQMLADYASLLLFGEENVSETLRNTHSLLKLSPHKIARGEDATGKLFAASRRELFAASINSQANALSAQTKGARKAAEGYKKEAKKPGNSGYAEEYGFAAQEQMNRAALLEASRALVLEAGRIGAKQGGVAGKGSADSGYLLGKAGEFAAIANGSRSLVSYGEENPAEMLAKESAKIVKNPGLILDAKEGARYELLSLRAMMGVRAERNVYFSDSLMRQAGKAEGLSAAQRKEVQSWLAKASELSDNAGREMGRATKEAVETSNSMMGTAEYYIDAARQVLAASAIAEKGAGGKRASGVLGKTIGDAIRLHSRAGESFSKSISASGEEAASLLESGRDSGERAGILLREAMLYSTLSAHSREIREKGTNEQLLRFRAGMKQMENGMERIAAGEDTDAAIRSMEDAEGRLARITREARLEGYSRSLKKHKGSAYHAEMEKVGERAGEILEGKGEWGKFASDERMALFDEILSTAVAHERREARLLSFRKMISSFAQKKGYAKLLNEAAEEAGSALHGEGKWAQENALMGAERFGQVMAEAERYASYFLPSSYATGAKGREDGREIGGQGLAAAERDLKERSGEKLLPAELCRKHQGMVLRGLLHPELKIDVEAERRRVAIYKRAADELYLGLAAMGTEVNMKKREMVTGQKKARETPHMRGGGGEYYLSEAARRAGEALEKSGAHSRLRKYAGAAVRSAVSPTASNRKEMEKARGEAYASLGKASEDVQKTRLASIGASQAQKVARSIAQEREAMEESARLAQGLRMEMRKHPEGSRERGSISASILVLERKMRKAEDRIAALEGAYSSIGRAMGKGLEAENAARISRLERERDKKEQELAALQERVETLSQEAGMGEKEVVAAAMVRAPGERGDEEEEELERAIALRDSTAGILRRTEEELRASGGEMLTAGQVRKKGEMEEALNYADELLSRSDRGVAQARLANLAALQVREASANVTAERHMGILRGISKAEPQREASSRNAMEKASRAAVLLEYGGGRFGGSESAFSRVRAEEAKIRKGGKPSGADSERAFEEFREATGYLQASSAASEAKANSDAEFKAHENEKKLLLSAWKNVREGEEMERPSWNSGLGEEAEYGRRAYENSREEEKNAAAMSALSKAGEVWRLASGGVGDSAIPAARAKEKLDSILSGMGGMNAAQISARVDSIEKDLEDVKSGNEVSKWAELATLPLDFLGPVGFASIITKMGGGMLEGYALTGEGPGAMDVISLAAITSSKLGGLSSAISASRIYRATQIATPIYFTAHSASGFSETFEAWRKTGYLDPTMLQEAIFMLSPLAHMSPHATRRMPRSRRGEEARVELEARESRNSNSAEAARRRLVRGPTPASRGGPGGEIRFLKEGEEGAAAESVRAELGVRARARRLGRRRTEKALKTKRVELENSYRAYSKRVKRGGSEAAELEGMVNRSIKRLGIKSRGGKTSRDVLESIPKYLSAEQKGAEAAYKLAYLAKLADSNTTFIRITRLRYRGYRDWISTPEGEEYTRTRTFHVEDAEGVIREVAERRGVEPGSEVEFFRGAKLFAEGGSINMEVATESLIMGMNSGVRELSGQLLAEAGTERYVASIRTDLSNTGLVNNTGRKGRMTGNLYMGADYMLPLGMELPENLNRRLEERGINAVAVAANTAKASDEITIRIVAADKQSMEIALGEATALLNEQASNSPHFGEAIEKANAITPGTFPGEAYFRYGIVVGKLGPKTTEADFKRWDNAADDIASVAAKKLSASESAAKKYKPAGIAFEAGAELEVEGAGLQKMKLPEEKEQDVSIVSPEFAKRAKEGKVRAPRRGEYMHNENPETGGIQWPELVDASEHLLAAKFTPTIKDAPLRRRIMQASEKSGKAHSQAMKGELTLPGANAIHSGLGDELVTANNYAMKLTQGALVAGIRSMGMGGGKGKKVLIIGNRRDAHIMLTQRGNNPTLQIWITKKFINEFNGGRPLAKGQREALAKFIWASIKGAEAEGSTYYDASRISMGVTVLSSGDGFGEMPMARKKKVAAGVIRTAQSGKPMREKKGRAQFENFSEERDAMENAAAPINGMLELLSREPGTFEERVGKKVEREYRGEVIGAYRALFGKRLDVVLENVGPGKTYRVRELLDLEYALEGLAKEGKFGKNGKKYAEGVLEKLKDTSEGSAARRIRELHEFSETAAPLETKGRGGVSGKASGE